MPISSEQYRHAMRLFPAGVTIVAIKAAEKRHGLTISAFASVSPDPPLICVIVDHEHFGYQLLEEEGAVFSVNILGEDQADLSNRFAWVKDEDRFAMGNWGEAVTGAPILEDALGWLDCTIHDRFASGTHTIYIGEVQAHAMPRPDVQPLVYWNRGYRHFVGGES